MPNISLLQGDCLQVLKTLEENSVDSIVTDPPYELGFMGKSWDNTGIAEARINAVPTKLL
jgi:site-specific DNA-methyltransferase (adenine-specific)